MSSQVVIQAEIYNPLGDNTSYEKAWRMYGKTTHEDINYFFEGYGSSKQACIDCFLRNVKALLPPGIAGKVQFRVIK